MRKQVLAVLVVVAALVGVGGAAAAGFVLSPVTMAVNPAESLSTFTTVTNAEEKPVEFTAEVMLWTQKDGKEVLTPARDALVSPMRFKVAPGKSQVVRIALRSTPKVPSVTYRLVLRQELQPEAAPEGRSSVTPRYVFSLPVFVEKLEARPALSVTAQRLDGRVQLVFRNAGSGYAVLRQMQVTAGERRADLGNQYVLPGSTMVVPLPAELSGVPSLVLTGQDADQKVTRVNVNVP
ncbi:hypothetical protein DEIGR_200201 [Deinococcus grandis]|uniref:Pili assembly chaperone N-terminal domain-containing protein n=1 Tax=Deinococcus grandis TaxID=57498 RepID=A0A100HM90_9DEIO|nr:fimbria/pilus periplasmic chaperone [Deinococcus grandis]BBN96686.1 hypothetical protein DEGR_34190 [Deinococcus grandis]GAQ23346.1 hypothetical protein DEIGR_200201 [Deinococcus grandis]